MSNLNPPIATGRGANGQQQHNQAHIDQLEAKCIRARQQFISGSLQSASVRATRHRTDELINLVITQNPSCPRSASRLVDRLNVDQESLEALDLNGGCDG